MSRKRTKQLKLVLLGSLGAALSGCGGCGPDMHQLAGEIDPVLAKRAAAAGAAAELMDGIGLTGGLFAAGPILGVSAPVGLANLGSMIDQADETMDVASRISGIPRSTSPSNQPTRTRYYYHSHPGIGWFVWGHAIGWASGRSYTPPRYYAPSPNQISSQRTYTSSSGGGGGFGRSAPIGGGSGSVSRGGFGSSGAAHASGGGGS
jgi:hypothetical protein